MGAAAGIHTGGFQLLLAAVCDVTIDSWVCLMHGAPPTGPSRFGGAGLAVLR